MKIIAYLLASFALLGEWIEMNPQTPAWIQTVLAFAFLGFMIFGMPCAVALAGHGAPSSTDGITGPRERAESDS